MSHFAKLSVQVKNRKLAEKVANSKCWHFEHVAKYENPWKYAKESIDNCDLLKDAHGHVKMAIKSNGEVIHDEWSMGKEAYSFLQDYSEEYIRNMAKSDGAVVSSKGVDAEGCRILEIEYF